MRPAACTNIQNAWQRTLNLICRNLQKYVIFASAFAAAWVRCVLCAACVFHSAYANAPTSRRARVCVCAVHSSVRRKFNCNRFEKYISFSAFASWLLSKFFGTFQTNGLIIWNSVSIIQLYCTLCPLTNWLPRDKWSVCVFRCCDVFDNIVALISYLKINWNLNWTWYGSVALWRPSQSTTWCVLTIVGAYFPGK